jgi:dolichol-phosphate mannosyltransferase
VRDVPIVFRERVAGESKLTMKQNYQYIQQLAALYWDFYWVLVLVGILLIAAYVGL